MSSLPSASSIMCFVAAPGGVDLDVHVAERLVHQRRHGGHRQIGRRAGRDGRHLQVLRSARTRRRRARARTLRRCRCLSRVFIGSSLLCPAVRSELRRAGTSAAVEASGENDDACRNGDPAIDRQNGDAGGKPNGALPVGQHAARPSRRCPSTSPQVEMAKAPQAQTTPPIESVVDDEQDVGVVDEEERDDEARRGEAHGGPAGLHRLRRRRSARRRRPTSATGGVTELSTAK